MPVPSELTDKSRGVRLQKAMAQAGVASRRRCEELVEQGRIRVNGEAVTDLPAWVDAQRDRIELDGEPIGTPPRRKSGRVQHTYLMVNKPRRVISTNQDPAGRKRVLDLIDAPIRTGGKRPRLFPVGRLDADSTGLILLTDDGELTQRLTHPRHGIAKQYQVTVRGRVSEEDLQRLRDGLHLANRHDAPGTPAGGRRRSATKAAVEKVYIIGREKDRARGESTKLAVTLREGRNREIRRLLARLGFKVRALRRTAMGPLKLKGVPLGGWRLMTTGEVRLLRRAAGLKG